MKIKIVLALFVAVFLSTGLAKAADTLVFDSTDNYTGGCQLTNESTWTLDKDLDISTFQMWYKWDEGETTLPIIVSKDGQEFASFTATRTTCDTYQKSWCNADFSINKIFPKGTYTTKVFNAKQCLKPGGTGAIRLYSSDSSDVNRASTSTKPTTSRVGIYGGIIAGVVIVGIVVFIFTRKKK